MVLVNWHFPRNRSSSTENGARRKCNEKFSNNICKWQNLQAQQKIYHEHKRVNLPTQTADSQLPMVELPAQMEDSQTKVKEYQHKWNNLIDNINTSIRFTNTNCRFDNAVLQQGCVFNTVVIAQCLQQSVTHQQVLNPHYLSLLRCYYQQM